MKKLRIEKKVGIWVNVQEAYVVNFGSPGSARRIGSGILSRVRTPGETKGFMQFETTYANTEAHQQSRNVQLKKKYFRKLTELIHDADYIYIAGPGKTKNELKNLIEKEAFLNGKITHVDATGELTRKQVIALVNDYFSGGRFKIKERVLT